MDTISAFLFFEDTAFGELVQKSIIYNKEETPMITALF